MARGAFASGSGHLFQAFPYGGKIEIVEVIDGRWVEFVPTPGVDLYLIEAPLTEGRIVHTNGGTHPEIVSGANVSLDQLRLSISVYPGQDVLCLDVDTPSKLFFTIVDAPVGTRADLLLMGAAK